MVENSAVSISTAQKQLLTNAISIKIKERLAEEFKWSVGAQPYFNEDEQTMQCELSMGIKFEPVPGFPYTAASISYYMNFNGCEYNTGVQQCTNDAEYNANNEQCKWDGVDFSLECTTWDENLMWGACAEDTHEVQWDWEETVCLDDSNDIAAAAFALALKDTDAETLQKYMARAWQYMYDGFIIS